MALLVEGQRFERYRVIRWLGSGVAGESYEVENVMLQQKATLKLIHPWATLAEAARRQFFREMQSICMFRHPYLAEVIDYGEIDAQLYVARRYVSNGSLLSNEGRVLFRPPFPVNKAIQYGSQIAQALAYIHQQHAVHGALTLGNVLALHGPNREHTPNNAPFLLSDVGLAYFVRRFGQPKLSLMPLTAAPEQLNNSATPITAASDQFSLAVIIYLWLTGRPPYLGSPVEIAHLKLTATIVPPTAFNPQLTFEQEGVLLRALSARPEDRYPSIQSFTNALMTKSPTRPSQPLPSVFAIPAKRKESENSTDTSTPSTPPNTPNPPATTPIEPLPKPEPDIFIPTPEPTPLPEPLPQTVPEPAPETAPQPTEPEKPTIEPLPIPEPDIFRPIPETPLIPESLPQTEPLTEDTVADTNTPRQETASQEREHGEPETKIAHFIIASPFIEGTVEVILERNELTIGRAGSSDILLDYDDKTSRHHALLRREEGQYVLYDRQSAFGVFVNDEQIAANSGHILIDGDYICIGNYELIFLMSDSAATAITAQTLAVNP